MGKGAGPAPKYREAAEQTAASGQQAIDRQTQANRPNSTSPFASEQWTTNPDGTTTRTLGLTGGLGTAAAAAGNQVGNALSRPFDLSGMGPLKNGDDARREAIDASFGYAKSRLDPAWDAREKQEHARLINQGLDPNSQASRSSLEGLGRDRNDAYSGAMSAAIREGTAAGDSVFRNNLSAREQAIQELIQSRTQPIGELGALQGFLNLPGFATAGAGRGTDYFGATSAAGDWQAQDAQMQNQFWGDLASGIFGAARSAVPFAFPGK
jgi:hypothetical protein